MMDKEFLEWFYARLIHHYGVPNNIDYMLKFKSIIEAYDENKLTPNTALIED